VSHDGKEFLQFSTGRLIHSVGWAPCCESERWGDGAKVTNLAFNRDVSPLKKPLNKGIHKTFGIEKSKMGPPSSPPTT
jgi:hypothetical protein